MTFSFFSNFIFDIKLEILALINCAPIFLAKNEFSLYLMPISCRCILLKTGKLTDLGI